MTALDDLVDQLESIAAQLSDLALDRLRAASDSSADGGEPDPALVVEERRLLRARRAVEKAAAILRQVGHQVEGAPSHLD
jgi:hypothetical protein